MSVSALTIVTDYDSVDPESQSGSRTARAVNGWLRALGALYSRLLGGRALAPRWGAGPKKARCPGVSRTRPPATVCQPFGLIFGGGIKRRRALVGIFLHCT